MTTTTNMKEHIYRTKINMLKGKKHFHRQIDKFIKEKKEFDAGFGFNPECNCEKCQARKEKI